MAHIHPNRQSLRSSGEQFSTQAHNYRDLDQMERESIDSPNTSAVSQGRSSSHDMGTIYRRSPTHRQMGLRCNQTLHPGLTAHATTTSHTDQHRGAHSDQMTRSYHQFWIIRSTSHISHIPAITETCIALEDGTPSADGTTAHPPSRSPSPSLPRTGASNVSAMRKQKKYRRSTSQTRTPKDIDGLSGGWKTRSRPNSHILSFMNFWAIKRYDEYIVTTDLYGTP